MNKPYPKKKTEAVTAADIYQNWNKRKAQIRNQLLHKIYLKPISFLTKSLKFGKTRITKCSYKLKTQIIQQSFGKDPDVKNQELSLKTQSCLKKTGSLSYLVKNKIFNPKCKMQQSHSHKEPLNIIQLLQKEKKMPKSSYLFLNISPLITLESTSSNLEYCSQSSSYNRKRQSKKL